MVQTAPDYDAPDTLVVEQLEQLRALGDPLRSRVVTLLRERAWSTTELAEELGAPKGTVAHHLKVLEAAGLIRVVRTRKVRALTEKYYGRTARLFLLQSKDGGDTGGAFASAIHQAADEVARTADLDAFAALHLRLTEEDRARLRRRLRRIVDDFRGREVPDGKRLGLVLALYERSDGA